MKYDILRIHCDESLTTIKQVFADRSVSRAQIAYCYIVCANQLLAQHNIKRDSGAFLTIFDGIPLQISKVSETSNLVKDRKYIELPGLIFDFDKDGAIEYLAYTSDGGEQCPPRFTKVPLTRTSPSESRWLYLHPSTMPSPKNPYFYRIENFVYTLGLERTPITEMELGAYMTINPLQEINLDAPFVFPMELMVVLKKQVIDLIRYNWFFSSDRKADGDDTNANKTTNIPKTISINPQEQQQ